MRVAPRSDVPGLPLRRDDEPDEGESQNLGQSAYDAKKQFLNVKGIIVVGRARRCHMSC